MLRLLNFLLNYLMFAGTMFFAAGAAVDLGGGGAGAGDGAGAGTGTGEGDGAAADADGTSSGEGDGQPGDADAGGDGQGGTGDRRAAADPDAAVDLGDGRTVPAKIKKLFDVAKTAGVEKEIRQLYFQNERLTKAIPGGVKGAIELANSVEEFGGVEGIEQLQSDVESYHEDSELFESGSPKWIESAFTENPDAALKAFNNSLGYVAEKLGEHYDHVMAKVVLDTLDNGSPVANIYNLLASLKDNPQAQKAAEQLAAWYNAVKDTAKKIPEKKVDAREKALSDKEAKIEQREMGQRYTQVNAEVFPVMKGQVARTLEAEAKLVGVDLKKASAEYPAEFEDMLKKIHNSIMRTATKDKRFVDKHYGLIKKGDLKRAADAINAKHEKIVPEIVRTEAARYNFMKGKKKAAAADAGSGGGNKGADANAAASAGWSRVNAAPHKSTVNWSKTTQAMQLDGKYILNDGKKVQVHY